MVSWIKRLFGLKETPTDPEPERTIRAIIDRRLGLAGGECLISIRLVAKITIKKLYGEDTHSARRAMYKHVLQVLEEYDINYWGEIGQKGAHYTTDEIPISLHIYQVRHKKSEVNKNE